MSWLRRKDKRMPKGDSDRKEPPSADLVANPNPPVERQTPGPVGVPNPPTGGSQVPTTRDLGELYNLVLRDIQKWSQARGFSSVPPIVFLRQIADYSEAMGSVLYEDRDQGAGP